MRRGRDRCACDWRAASRRSSASRRRARMRRRRCLPSSADRRCRQPTAGSAPRRRSRAGRDRAAAPPGGPVWWCATAFRAAFAPWICVCFHQPLHLAARRWFAATTKRKPHPSVAVGVVVGRVQLPDPAEQPLVVESTVRAPPGGALIVGGHRHAQGPCRSARPQSGRGARRRSGSLRSVWVELPCEKQRRRPQDLVRTSQLRVLFAEPADLLPLFSREQVCAKPLVRLRLADALPQDLRVDAEISSDVRDRPVTLQRHRTPRSSNSCGYFRGLAMTPEDLLSPGQHPGIEVPAKPGPAQSPLTRLAGKPPGMTRLPGRVWFAVVGE